jgi:NAD(P)-dependent dehydrogenase (short-subunit alcohol dehydrogenase family)
VLVTGAARGLGLATARAFAERGARVAMLDVDGEALAAAAAEVPGALPVLADVTSSEALKRALSIVVEEFGGIDVVVANAGVASGGPVLHSDDDILARLVDVNLVGVMRTVTATLPILAASQGYVVTVSSLAAALPAPGMAAYAASKAGVEAFTIALRAEVAHLGIGVGCAYLSWVDTPLVRAAMAVPAMRPVVHAIPFGLGRPVPPQVAAAQLVAGITGRKARILIPRRIVLPALTLRGLLAGPVAALAGRSGQRLDADFGAVAHEHGRTVSGALLGPGGRAAMGNPDGPTPAEAVTIPASRQPQ